MENLNDFKIQKENLDKLSSQEFAEAVVEHGIGKVQETLGISDIALARYYKVAIQFLERKLYSKAFDAFLFLTFINPCVHNFWIGLGVSQQCMAEYENALAAYIMAEAIDPTSPIPHSNSYQCYAALGEKVKAELCWITANECCDDKEEWRELKEKLVRSHQQSQ